MSQSRNTAIFDQIICRYDPDFTRFKEGRRRRGIPITDYDLSCLRMHWDMESGVERALAKMSGRYGHTPEYHRDFDDNSDSKVISVRPSGGTAEINSVEKKIGALRVTIWNPHAERLDFMYMPFAQWPALARNATGGNKGNGRKKIVLHYSKKNDSYGKFDAFLVPGFKELAQSKK